MGLLLLSSLSGLHWDVVSKEQNYVSSFTQVVIGSQGEAKTSIRSVVKYTFDLDDRATHTCDINDITFGKIAGAQFLLTLGLHAYSFLWSHYKHCKSCEKRAKLR